MTEKITKLDELKKLADGSGHSGKSRFFFYEALIDTELYLLLEKELEGGVACPKLIETSEDKYALVFDTIARLVDFTEDSSPYLALGTHGSTYVKRAEARLGFKFKLGSSVRDIA